MPRAKCRHHNDAPFNSFVLSFQGQDLSVDHCPAVGCVNYVAAYVESFRPCYPDDNPVRTLAIELNILRRQMTDGDR